jgi:hypothetical protein
VLAEYLAYLSALFGESANVHFDKLEDGSVAIVQRVDEPAVPKVRQRLRKAQRPDAPDDIRKPKKALNDALSRIGAKAVLIDGKGHKMVDFKGKDKPERIGPIEQEGQLDGVLIWIGGQGHPARADFQSKEAVYRCTLDRDMAKELSPHLYREPLRVFGQAVWYRDPDSGWELENFRFRSFEQPGGQSLSGTVIALRAVEGSAWRYVDDPLAELHRIRHGEG